MLVLITHLLNAHVRFALDLEKAFDVIIRIVRVEARLHSTFQISRWKQNRQLNRANPKWHIIPLQNLHFDLKYVHANSFFHVAAGYSMLRIDKVHQDIGK